MQKETSMVRVFRWDGKELFINPNNIMFIEKLDNQISVTLVNGDPIYLSETSYDILSEHQSPKQNKPGFGIV